MSDVFNKDLLASVLNTFSLSALILDSERNILFVNDFFSQNIMHKGNSEVFLGLKPGEAFHCVHFNTSPEQCGKTPLCRYCDFLTAFEKAKRDAAPVESEITLKISFDEKIDYLDFMLRCNPFSSSFGVLYIVTLQNLSDQKRKFNLESIFFHDILNSASGIKGLLQLVTEAQGSEEQNLLIQLCLKSIEILITEIENQRVLSKAESGDLLVNKHFESLYILLTQASESVKAIEQEKSINIQIRGNREQLIYTDESIFFRVMQNLLKNAVEASNAQDQVIVEYGENADGEVFVFVQNPAVMTESIQRHIFHKGGSSKGLSRGYGTYSVRLLVVDYLEGRVRFRSNKEEGTVFEIYFPVQTELSD